MLKRLLFFSCAALLAYRSPAQSIINSKVKLPAELLGPAPGAARSPLLAGRLSTVSQLQELLAQNWSGGWVDNARQVYLRYRTSTRPGTIRVDRKTGGSWVLSSAHRYRYTSADEILSDSTDQYQVAPYGPYFASISTFNTPRQVRWEWEKVINPAGGSTAPWDSIRRTSHTYNAAGQRIQVLEEFYAGGLFSAALRRLLSYNALGQVSGEEAQTNAGPTTWNPFQRFAYTYNAAGKLQQAIAETVPIGGNTYVNSARNTLSFDAQGREILLDTESWDNNAWVPSSHTVYAYAANGDLTTATLQAWNAATATYQNSQRLVFSYAQVTATRNASTSSLQLAAVPNPSSGASAEVRYQLLAAAPASVELLDLAGRRVAVAQPAQMQPAGAHRVSLAGLGLVPGLYLVRLRAGTQSQTVKLVVD